MGVFGKFFGWDDRNLGAGRGPIPRRRNGDWVLSRDLRLQAEHDADLMIEAAMLGLEDEDDDSTADSVTAINLNDDEDSVEMNENGQLAVVPEVAFMGKRVLPKVVNEPDDNDSGDSEYKKHDFHAPSRGVMGKLEEKAHALAHSPVFETTMILLIILEIAMVMIEIAIGATFEMPLNGFSSDYKKLVLSYTTAHPQDCAIVAADVPGYTGRLRFLEELYGNSDVVETAAVAGALQPTSMHGGVLEAITNAEMSGAGLLRYLSASSDGPVEVECQIMVAYSIHHWAEMISKVALSIMLFGIFVEVWAEGPKDFFCPSHIDIIHAAHLMDFVVIFSSWLLDFVFPDLITGSGGDAATILVVLRLWRVVRVISGMGTFIAKQKKSELEIIRIKRKLKHVYMYLDLKGNGALEDYFASDGEIDADEVRMMREIKEADHSVMTASMQLAEKFGQGGGEQKKRRKAIAKQKAAVKAAEGAEQKAIKSAERAAKREEAMQRAGVPGQANFDDEFVEENPAEEEGKVSGVISVD